jgi:hypothetical protein
MKILALLILATPIFSTEKLEFAREKGSSLTVFVDQPSSDSFSLVCIIPGSQRESVLQTHQALKEEWIKTGRGVVTIEKQGIEDEKQYFRWLSFHERIQDHLFVLGQLKKVLPAWNGKISFLGQGDGGRIGAKVATQTENVESLMLIATGGAWPAIEETLYSFRNEMIDGDYSPQYIHGFLVGARQEFAQALETPRSDRKAFGYTYKYWESLQKTQLLEDLRQLKCPILTVNGTRDNRVPIQSLEPLVQALQEQITAIRKEEAGREILQDHSVYQEALSWLQEQLQ